MNAKQAQTIGQVARARAQLDAATATHTEAVAAFRVSIVAARAVGCSAGEIAAAAGISRVRVAQLAPKAGRP